MQLLLRLSYYSVSVTSFILRPRVLLNCINHQPFLAEYHNPYAAVMPTVLLLGSSSETRRCDVNGINCTLITIDDLNATIVEATAQQQDILVDWALEEDEIPSGDPYGAVLWPAARTLARRLVFETGVKGRNVWEVGAGTGLVSIAVAIAGARKVYATDYESIPLTLLDYAATNLNNVGDIIETSHWDVCDCNHRDLPSDADILVAADLLYEPVTGKALASLVVRALQAGMEVMVADSPGRAGRPAFLAALNKKMRNPVNFFHVIGTTVTGERHELICGPTSTSVSDTEQPLPIAIVELHPYMLTVDR